MTTPYKLLAAVILLVLTAIAALGFGMNYGRAMVQAAWDAEKLEVAAEIARIRERQTVVNQVVETVYVDRVQVIREQGKTIIKKVPQYVPSNTPPLPPGWRLLHDAAASGSALPDTPSLADVAPVGADTAAVTVAENYASCRQAIEQVKAWQEWARKQAAASARSARQPAPPSTQDGP